MANFAFLELCNSSAYQTLLWVPLNTKSINTKTQLSYDAIVTNQTLRIKDLKTESIIDFVDA